MNEGLIPRRYAKALLKVAVERKCDSEIYKLMENLVSAFVGNDDLRKLVANPFVSAQDKINALRTAAGDKDNPTFDDFLRLLVQNRRIDLCFPIANAYLDLYRKENNIRLVELISASKLNAEVENRIKSLIKNHLNGASMQFSSKVDPDIIGGFIVTVDNERLDASLRNKLKEIRLGLINN